MYGKLIIVNVPSDNPKATAEFYESILGVEFARSFNDAYVAYHAPITDEGALLQVSKKHGNETTVCYYAVEDLKQEIDKLTKKGAKVTWPPCNLPISKQVFNDYARHYKHSFGGDAADTVGQGAVLTDPAGNEFGLIELHEHAHAMFKFGAHRTHVKHVSSERLAIHARTVEIGKQLK